MVAVDAQQEPPSRLSAPFARRSRKIVKKPGAHRLTLSQGHFTLKGAKHPHSPYRRRSDCVEGSYLLIESWFQAERNLFNPDRWWRRGWALRAGFSRQMAGPRADPPEETRSRSELPEDLAPDAGHVGDGGVDHLGGACLQDLAEQEKSLLRGQPVIGV